VTRFEQEIWRAIAKSFVIFPYARQREDERKMGKTPQAAFVMWLFLTVMLGILWVLVQYGRSLWMRMKTVYVRILWMQQTGLLSRTDGIPYKVDDDESSQEGKDKEKS
jgi:fatty acid desaturase